MAPSLVWVGLGLLIVGNGFFKPNISTVVGQLYSQTDLRKDGAYTIFYMGINLGALFSPLVCGYLGQKVGWAWGFGSAGVGMLVGVVWFWTRQHTLVNEETGSAVGLSPSSTLQRLGPSDYFQVVTYSVASIVLVGACVLALPILGPSIWSPHWLFGESAGELMFLFLWRIPLALALLLLLGRLTASATKKSEPISGSEMRGLIMVGLATLAFFLWIVGFEQAGGTMNLFADERTRLTFLGISFPSSWFQSVNPVFILLLAPVFDRFWQGGGRGLSTIQKQGVGLILMGLCFALMAWAESGSNQLIALHGKDAAAAKVSPLWLVAVYFLATCGELCISPLGVSVVQTFSPKRIVSLMMGVFFMGAFAGNNIAGILEEVLKSHNVGLWRFLLALMFGTGVFWLLVSVPLQRFVGRRK